MHVLAVAGGSAGRWFTRSTRAEGADASGLASLIDLHAIQSAGDALLTVALANTLFFSVAVDQARSRVALYLLITMAPFSLIAPVIGPLARPVPQRPPLRAGHDAGPARIPGLGDGRRGRLEGCLRPLPGGVRRAGLLEGLRGIPKRGRAAGVAAERHAGARQCPTHAVGRARRDSCCTDRPGSELGDRLAVLDIAALCAVVYLGGTIFAIRLPERVDSSEGEVRLRRRPRKAAAGSRRLRDGSRREERCPVDVPPDPAAACAASARA